MKNNLYTTGIILNFIEFLITWIYSELLDDTFYANTYARIQEFILKLELKMGICFSGMLIDDWLRICYQYGNKYITWNSVSNHVNSLSSSDALWWYKSRSTLAQVMACCLMAPSHYLNQCWLIVGEVLWHSPEGNFTWNAQDIYPWREFEKYQFQITSASPRDQWVKEIHNKP